MVGTGSHYSKQLHVPAAQGVPNGMHRVAFPSLWAVCPIVRAELESLLPWLSPSEIHIKQSARYTLYQLLYWAALRATS